MRVKKREIELLAPAKNIEVGKIAILSGADAVYIGADRFGAREAAGNSVEDIKELANFAHFYGCKVFVTLNTILFEYEVEKARQLAWDIWEAGADALIIQDMSFLELDMPPIPLHASTQMDNRTPDKVKFLADCGMDRVVLARELTHEQIKEIHDVTDVELEAFIHGSLCVCFSGQCYLSHHIGGRSANRGACAQPCRMKWDLESADGQKIIKDRHLLSLKDMNRVDSLEDMVLNGVSSLKIEGRLKDADYVRNIVGFYRKKLDEIIEKHSHLKRVGEGIVSDPVANDPEKSFNRGFTDFFLNAKREKMANFQSPKSMGKYIGKVTKKRANEFIVDTNVELNNGDGLCFLTKTGEMKGVRINKVEGNKISLPPRSCLYAGAEVYRNFDQKYQNDLKAHPPTRKIKVCVNIIEEDGAVFIEVKDQQGVAVKYELPGPFEGAKNEEMALANIKKQVSKMGDYPLHCTRFKYLADNVYFFRMGDLNQCRREALDQYMQMRHQHYVRKEVVIEKNKMPWPGGELDFHANISNSFSMAFWKRHGAEVVSMAFEMQTLDGNEILMTSKYCLKYQMGCCPKQDCPGDLPNEPLYMTNDSGRYRLVFDCKNCQMKMISEPLD